MLKILYRIKPLHKKSIEALYDFADNNRRWSVTETYRWGQGFIESDMDCNLPWQGDDVAYARTDAGWGCEFDDSVSIEWEFSDDISGLEQQELKELYYEGGAGWLYDGEHDWQEEDAAVHIIAPYQVSLCDEDGTVIEENVKLKTRPTTPSNAWPFPT